MFSKKQHNRYGSASYGSKDVRRGSYNINRFNPQRFSLEAGSIVEQSLPRDPVGLNKLHKMIYLRGSIAGPAVDLYKTLPWSDWTISGLKDPKIKRIYEDCLNALDVKGLMPHITGEYLIFGRSIVSLLFDETKGYFTSSIVQDQDFCRITPIFVEGFDPKIDVMPTPGMRQFIASKDPRDLEAKKRLPKELLKQLRTNSYIPLEPANTLFLPRRAFGTDHLGTSYYSRLIDTWALRVGLINAQLIQVKRRAGAIRHAVVGTDNWEPNSDEMEDIAGTILQADEDPVGAVIVTRQGVEIGEVPGAGGGAVWKMADEWSYIMETELRSLGLSETFLTGDATYGQLEMATSAFVEQLLALRWYLTKKTIIDKILTTVARVNQIYKTTSSELDLGIRTSVSLRAKTEEVGFEDLLLPRFEWNKKFKPISDETYMGILGTMEEKGLPVTLQSWATAGGFDIDREMDLLPEDIKLRKKVSEYKKKIPNSGGDDEFGGGDFGGGGDETEASHKLQSKDPMWKNGKFIDLDINTFSNILARSFTSKELQELSAKDNRKEIISEKIGQRNAELSEVMLMRLGVFKPREISPEINNEVVRWIIDSDISGQEMLRELYKLSKISRNGKTVSSREMSGLLSSAACTCGKEIGDQPDKSHLLLSGAID